MERTNISLWPRQRWWSRPNRWFVYCSAHFWKRGWGAVAHLYLRRHTQKHHNFASTQKWSFTEEHNNW